MQNPASPELFIFLGSLALSSYFSQTKHTSCLAEEFSAVFGKSDNKLQTVIGEVLYSLPEYLFCSFPPGPSLHMMGQSHVLTHMSFALAGSWPWEHSFEF